VYVQAMQAAAISKVILIKFGVSLFYASTRLRRSEHVYNMSSRYIVWIVVLLCLYLAFYSQRSLTAGIDGARGG